VRVRRPAPPSTAASARDSRQCAMIILELAGLATLCLAGFIVAALVGAGMQEELIAREEA